MSSHAPTRAEGALSLVESLADRTMETSTELMRLVALRVAHGAKLKQHTLFDPRTFTILAERFDVVMPHKEKIPLWLANVNDPKTPANLKGIFSTVQSLLAQLEEGGSASVDLGKIKLETANPRHLVAVLRSLYAWRTEINGWHDTQRSARQQLERREGLDVEDLMQGLDR